MIDAEIETMASDFVNTSSDKKLIAPVFHIPL